MTKHKFDDQSKLLALIMRFRIKCYLTGDKERVFIVVTNHKSDLRVDLKTCIVVAIILTK